MTFALVPAAHAAVVRGDGGDAAGKAAMVATAG
jgi:hypothetical protein